MESIQANINVVRLHTAAQRRSYCRRRGRATMLGVCWVVGVVQCFYIGSFRQVGWICLLIVKVPYLHNIKFISAYCTSFPSWVLSEGFHTQNNCLYLMWCCECFSVFIFRCNTSKWSSCVVSSKQLHILFSPSLDFKGKFTWYQSLVELNLRDLQQ